MEKEHVGWVDEGVAEGNLLEKKLPLPERLRWVGQPVWKARTNDIGDKLSRAALYRRRDR